MYNVKELMEFLDSGLSSYHVVGNIKSRLLEAGFGELSESGEWKLGRGGAYYCVRNDSSVIAFRVPGVDVDEIKGFHIFAAHSDSLAFKIKENPEIKKENYYVNINVEKYGGMILSTWLDRPLTVAGRVFVERDGGLVSYPVRLKDNFCMIPNLAIHLNREINENASYKVQSDMLPLVTLMQSEEGGKGSENGGNAAQSPTLNGYVAEALSRQYGENYEGKDILASDLYVVNSQKSVLAGACDEFIMSARFDDLGCVFAGLKGMLDAKAANYIDVFAVFDNEEVGSLTRQGADSTFLRDTLDNIAEALGATGAIYRRWKADSFMLSADNAHACHPNFASKYDLVNKPYINKGVVLKHHGGQKYATDAYSAAYLRRLCRQNDIALQDYSNNSDIAGGSTLGNIAMAQVSMPTADIGLAQLAMHSAYETAGVYDVELMIRLAEVFFGE